MLLKKNNRRQITIPAQKTIDTFLHFFSDGEDNVDTKRKTGFATCFILPLNCSSPINKTLSIQEAYEHLLLSILERILGSLFSALEVLALRRMLERHP